LESGVELHELRARPENPRGTGQSQRLSRYGNYSLHAKLLVFDRSGLYVGSMNYDQRSRRRKTEDGMMTPSSEPPPPDPARFSRPDAAGGLLYRHAPAGPLRRSTATRVAYGQGRTAARPAQRAGAQRLGEVRSRLPQAVSHRQRIVSRSACQRHTDAQ